MMDGVHFKAVLPLRWQTEDGMAALEGARYLAVLAEFEHRSSDKPKEQMDLHAKLDLALLWLARSLSGEMPNRCQVWVGQEQLCWQSATPKAVGSQGVLALNLSDALPFLLQLPAQIQACTQEGSYWNITAKLRIHDEDLLEEWERMVFRHHRRAIHLERGSHT